MPEEKGKQIDREILVLVHAVANPAPLNSISRELGATIMETPRNYVYDTSATGPFFYTIKSSKLEQFKSRLSEHKWVVEREEEYDT